MIDYFKPIHFIYSFYEEVLIAVCLSRRTDLFRSFLSLRVAEYY